MITRRWICVLVAVLMLLSVAPMASPVSAAKNSGQCGNDVYWKFEGDTLTFYGTGPMADVGSNTVGNWYRFSDEIVHVVFEDGITYLGQHILRGDSYRYHNVKTITIPQSVTQIGSHAFSGLKSLEAVYITDLKSWCTIEYAADSNPLQNGAALYLNGQRIESLEIPSDIKWVEPYAFVGCSSLQRVDVPATVKEIGAFAFNSCANLKEIYFYGNAPWFGKAVFTGSYVTAYYPVEDPTWTEALRQSVGGKYVTWVPVEGLHQHTVRVAPAKAPTCTETGLTEGQQCIDCGEVLAEQEMIPALGHAYEAATVAPTCLEPGYDLLTCTRCGKTKRDNATEALGHLFGPWETIKEPTLAEEGLESRKCQNCDLKEERPLEKLTQPPTQPPTQPAPTQPQPTKPTPTQPPASYPTEPAPTAPDVQIQPQPADLVPWIIVGAVLLVAAAAGMVFLFRKKSE